MMQLKPETGEGASQYATKLRKAGDKCDFSNWTVEKMIKSLMIANMSDEELRLKFLQKEHTLDEIIDTCQKKEDAVARSKIMHGSGDSAKKIKHQQKYKQKVDQSKGKPQEESKKSDGSSCPRCGYGAHENSNQCPANGRTCNYCKKQGHFASVCFKGKGKPIKQVEDNTERDTSDTDSSDDEGQSFKVEGTKKVSGKTTLMRVMTNEVEVLWQPDTGATKDIWDEPQLRKYERLSNSKVELQPTNVRLYAYGSKNSLTVLGKFEAKLEAGKYSTLSTIYVTKESSSYPLLSETTSEKLNLVTYNKEFMVKKIGGKPEKFDTKGMRPEIASIIQENKEVFSGKIGKSKTRQVTIMIDKKIKPVVQKPRRIPYNLMDRAEAKLETLLEQDIIEKFPDDEPRTWVSPPVVAQKPNSDDVRFCVDMRMANEAIQRPYTQIPTTEDIVTKFQGATTYSKIDLKEAYHQFELTPESRNITTFYGPKGLMRYKRLNYGTKSAQDILQIEMLNILAGIENQVNISDDIMVGGTTVEHDAALAKVLERLRENGITVNLKKCVFDVPEIEFVGLVFNKDGIKPNPRHVQNLHEASPPENKSEMRSFLGMVGFLERFIADYATLVAPLRELIKASRWKWGEEQQKAFEKVKASIDEYSQLHHYVVGRETELVVDASETGLGCVLMQRPSKNEPYEPVMFRSKALKESEQGWSPTERESLAIRWAVKKLRKYLIGAPKFRIVSDHKPLKYMFHKTHGDLPPRVEKMVMDLQAFDYTIIYVPGKWNISDYLSRRHAKRTGTSSDKEVEIFVKNVVEVECCHVINERSAVTIEMVRKATESCKLMSKLKEAIKNGQFENDEELKAYRAPDIRNELCITNGLVCRGKRIIVPPTLQHRVVELCHDGHQGVTKAKSLLRTFCWFPCIDKLVEKQIRQCLPCQSVRPPIHKEPIQPSKLPQGPWQYVEMDFQGPYPKKMNTCSS